MSIKWVSSASTSIVSCGHTDEKVNVKMLSLLVLTLVASASAMVYFDSQCPEIKRVDNFDLAAYAKGVWYEIGRYPNRAEINSNCGDARYKLEGDIFQVQNTFVKDKKFVLFEGSGRLAEDAGNSGKIIFSLPYGIAGKRVENDFNVLATDYENYSIGYYCRYDEERKSRQDFAFILARNKILSSDVKAKIDNFLKESKILYSDKFVWSDFSDEACYIEA